MSTHFICNYLILTNFKELWNEEGLVWYEEMSPLHDVSNFDYKWLSSNQHSFNLVFSPLEIFCFPLFFFQTSSQSLIILQNTLLWVVLQKGELISMSSAKFSAGADGSLYLVSPGGEESGEYTCTATNAAGSAKRKVQLTVYGESPWAGMFFLDTLWLCPNSHFPPK